MNKLFALILALSTACLYGISEIDHLMQQQLVAYNIQKTLEEASKEPVEKRDNHKRTIVEKDGLIVMRVDWELYSAPAAIGRISSKAWKLYWDNYFEKPKEKRAEHKEVRSLEDLTSDTITQCTSYIEEKKSFVRCDYAFPSDFYAHLLILAKEQAKKKQEEK